MGEDQIIKTLTAPSLEERALIVRRADGAYSYRRQWLHHNRWGAIGPYCGIYDSEETAEAEARGRIPWLISLLN